MAWPIFLLHKDGPFSYIFDHIVEQPDHVVGVLPNVPTSYSAEAMEDAERRDGQAVGRNGLED